jgi:hypothetical protein
MRKAEALGRKMLRKKRKKSSYFLAVFHEICFASPYKSHFLRQLQKIVCGTFDTLLLREAAEFVS